MLKEGELLGIVGVARDMREAKVLMQKEKELAAQTTAATAEHQRADETENMYNELEEAQVASLNIMEDLDRQRTELEAEVTARKRAEEGLRESEARSRAIVETATDAIITIDERGTIASFNQGAERMFGYVAGEVMGQRVNMLMPSPDSERHDGYIENYLKTGEAKIIGIGRDVIGRRKDGSVFPMYLSISEVRLGDRVLFTGIARDMTQLKQADAELRQKTEELARSNEELEQFAYVASHDLQEPLRKVASYTQLLERRYKGRLDSKADVFITSIVDGARRMQALVRDLLTYSRTGTEEMSSKPSDVSNVMRSALANLETMIQETGAVVTHDHLPTLKVNPTRMGQLLQNLIANAIKFHGKETSRVHISVEQKSDEWVFSVRDNGIGIEPRNSERIFQIFRRANARSTYPGTGIGLAICKKIIERHGGRIWVESKLGKGSTFYFTVPRMEGNVISKGDDHP